MYWKTQKKCSRSSNSSSPMSCFECKMQYGRDTCYLHHCFAFFLLFRYLIRVISVFKTKKNKIKGKRGILSIERRRVGCTIYRGFNKKYVQKRKLENERKVEKIGKYFKIHNRSHFYPFHNMHFCISAACLCVCEWVPVRGISLKTKLDLGIIFKMPLHTF